MNEEKMNKKLVVSHVCEQNMRVLRTKYSNQELQRGYTMFRRISFCSQIVRKKRNQQPSIARKLLIFNVDQPGLEPGTSRL